jgi:hypothetical protein
MEAAGFSEMLEISTRLHYVSSRKAAILLMRTCKLHSEKNITRRNIDAWNLMSKGVEESLIYVAYVVHTEQKDSL